MGTGGVTGGSSGSGLNSLESQPVPHCDNVKAMLFSGQRLDPVPEGQHGSLRVELSFQWRKGS